MMKRRTPFVTHFVALVTLLLASLAAHAQVTAPPIASLKGGRFAAPISVSLTSATPNAVIRFTLDGSEPTDTSQLYTAPIPIQTSTPLRAKAFGITPLTPSQIVTHTYLFNVSHTFPIIALSFKPTDFFNIDTGMYIQYQQKMERRANIELFEPNMDTAAFSKWIETEIIGTASASLPQKSLEIKSKNSLGSPTIPYKLFPDLPYTDYKRFVLSNSGNEWSITMFRDAMVSGLFREINDISDILQKPATLVQGYRPAVVYFNGQYWGIHNIRERMNTTYVDQHFNLSSTPTLTNYDLSENDMDLYKVLAGDSIAWFQFKGELQRSSRRFESDTSFAWMEQQMDIDNFTDYVLINVFADNTDWVSNNVRRFRERRLDGKWKWICYDFDFTFGLLTSSGFNTSDATQNALHRVLNPPFPGFSTALILQKCFENAKYRQKFANRMADFLNTAFSPARVQGKIQGFKTLYAPEIDKHRVRWGTPFPVQWSNNIQKILDFAGNRTGFTYDHFRLTMPELTDTTLVTLNVSPANAGTLKFNTLTLNPNRLPFVGKYFSGIPIPVKAVAAPGFRFSGWSNPNLGINDSVSVNFIGGSQSLTALFLPIIRCTTSDTVRLTENTCIPSAAGVFTNHFTNRFGCDSIVITIRTFQLLPKPIVNKNNNVLTSTISTSYQWFFNNIPLIGSVGQNHIAGNTGYYQVEITNAEGCIAKSDSVLVTIAPIFNCPAIRKNFGDLCDDGNPATMNDRVQTDCSCRGVVAFCTFPTNVAIGKTARQSSNYTTAYTASRAIDGNTSGTPSRTGFHTNAFWEINLGAQHNITELKLWNKTDIYLATPRDYYVFVSQNPFISTSMTTTLAQAGVHVYYQASGMARPTTLPIAKQGRYVRIQLRQRGYLNMSEVQVMGCVTPTISTIPTSGLRKQMKIAHETDSDFSVYPNPTSGDLNLNLQSFEHAETEIYIHNLIGNMILHQSLKDTPNEWSLKLEGMNLPNGIYIATLVHKGQAYSKRFVLI